MQPLRVAEGPTASLWTLQQVYPRPNSILKEKTYYWNRVVNKNYHKLIIWNFYLNLLYIGPDWNPPDRVGRSIVSLIIPVLSSEKANLEKESYKQNFNALMNECPGSSSSKSWHKHLLRSPSFLYFLFQRIFNENLDLEKDVYTWLNILYGFALTNYYFGDDKMTSF